MGEKLKHDTELTDKGIVVEKVSSDDEEGIANKASKLKKPKP